MNIRASHAGIRGYRTNRAARVRRAILGLCCLALLLSDASGSAAQRRSATLLVVETSRGRFAFETFDRDVPVSVAHVVSLAKKGFYDGQRVHRAVPGFVVQFGDPQTRNPDLRAEWGRGQAASSGTPIGVAEMSQTHKNVALSVGLAHMGDPSQADSQLYILLDSRPDLDGQYAVIGHVVEGEEVPATLQVGDEIRRVYVRE